IDTTRAKGFCICCLALSYRGLNVISHTFCYRTNNIQALENYINKLEHYPDLKRDQQLRDEPLEATVPMLWK
ncbi:6298_t:CDS:1, partial [Rhizophagus irregularis]